jgi:hypothetical protein
VQGDVQQQWADDSTLRGNATYLRNGQDFDVGRVRVAGCGFG